VPSTTLNRPALPMGRRGPVALWSPQPILPYCLFTIGGGLAWAATRTGNMGSAVRRCSTFVRIKRGFAYTQVIKWNTNQPL
jgi:hypothetical protein